MSTLGLLSALMKREFRRLASRRIYWFILILAPAFCFIFFADLLKQGLPMKLPIAVVDEDNTSLSRQLVRSLDAMAQTEVVMRTASFKEAREAMQTSRIYGIFHIPANFRQEVSVGKRPEISFYTNETYLLPGSLVYKNMRLQACFGKRGCTTDRIVGKRLGRTAIESQAVTDYSGYVSLE